MATAADSSMWGDIPTWLGVCGGLIAFVIGLSQYRRAQLWQRSEFVSKQMSEFFNDSSVKTALLLLDYSRIRLGPDGRRARPGDEGIVFDDLLCTRALRLHGEFADGEERFSPAEMMAREAFDALLTWLESFDHFIVTGLVAPKELEPYLRYWLRVLADPASHWKPPAFYEAVSRFITGYGYRGVRHLLQSVAQIELKSVEPAKPRPAEQYDSAVGHHSGEHAL